MKRLAFALLGAVFAFNGYAATALPSVDVYKSALCGCCGGWVEHMRQNGFEVRVHDVGDVPAARKALGMPEWLAACHTAKIGAYVVEGHVPAADVQRLLAAKPKALGIAVPSMPPGSPGMENPRPVPYETLLVRTDGSTEVFARH
jgi:hypothetical protein